jgi:hypothetical protein
MEDKIPRSLEYIIKGVLVWANRIDSNVIVIPVVESVWYGNRMLQLFILEVKSSRTKSIIRNRILSCTRNKVEALGSRT